MYQDHDLREDLDPQETQEWLEALDGVLKMVVGHALHF